MPPPKWILLALALGLFACEDQTYDVRFEGCTSTQITPRRCFLVMCSAFSGEDPGRTRLCLRCRVADPAKAGCMPKGGPLAPTP